MKILVAASSFLFALMLLGPSWAQGAGGDNPLKLSSDHVSLSVANLDKEQAFYEKVLGFKVESVYKGAPRATVKVAIPGYGINLTQRTGSVRHPHRVGSLEQGWFHITLATPMLDEVQKKLEAEKVRMTPEMVKGMLARLLIYDPEGNEIELIRAR